MNEWIDKKNISQTREVKSAEDKEKRQEHRRVSRNQFGRIKKKDHALDKKPDTFTPSD